MRDARAVAAIRRALGRDEHQHAIRVAVHETRHRGVAVLGERVLHHRRECLLLAAKWDHLAAYRVVRVIRVDERDEVGRDVDAEFVRRREALALLVGQVEDLLDIGQFVDAVRELPAPVVPLVVGHVGPQRRAPAYSRHPIRTQPARRVALVDERLLLERQLGSSFDCDFVRPPCRGGRAADCILFMQSGYTRMIARLAAS